MRRLKSIYRGFIDYEKAISDNENENLIKALKTNNLQNDLVSMKKLDCVIDELWVNTIEEGLEYVEKAVNEQRQFIRNEGEVINIEKAKSVNKHSITHLAKHANYITRVPENNEDIVPDKLYIEEKLSDYSVYENRFLYLLLTYLKDFISIRLDKIKEIMTSYDSSLKVNKDLYLDNKHILFNLDFKEEIKGDSLLENLYNNVPMIKRINNCLGIVIGLLNTPLIQEVSKSPMLKLPIIKTNVLKMNPNFRASVNLFEFISSYREDGFTFEENIINESPINENLIDEFANVVNLSSYFTYKHNIKLDDTLQNEYEKEEQELRELEEKKLSEELVKLKRKLKNKEIDPFEYIRLLEEENNKLKLNAIEISKLRTTIENKNEEINKLNDNILYLNNVIKDKDTNIEALKNEITLLKAKYSNDLAQLESFYKNLIIKDRMKYEIDLRDLTTKYNLEKNNIIKQYEQSLNDLGFELSRYKQENENLRNEYNKQLYDYDVKLTEANDNLNTIEERFNKKYDDLFKEYNNNVEKQRVVAERKITEVKILYDDQVKKIDKNTKASIEKLLTSFNNEKNELNEKYYNLLEEKYFLQGERRLNRIVNGQELVEEDYTSEDRFNELEKEYRAFKNIFNKYWKNTKKRIRNDYLWSGEDLKNYKKKKITIDDISSKDEIDINNVISETFSEMDKLKEEVVNENEKENNIE